MIIKRIRFIFLLLLALLPIIAILSTFIFTSVNSLVVFPSDKYDATEWWPYINTESTLDSFETTRQKIVFEYTLAGTTAYAGFGIFLDRDYPFLDLTGYSELYIKLTASKAKYFKAIIQTFEKGITQPKDGYYDPLRYRQVQENVKGSAYTINLADLKDSQWWITQIAPRGKALSTSPLKESYIIQFLFDDIELAGQRDRIEVEEISFHSSSVFLWTALAGSAIAYYSVFGCMLVIPRARRRIKHNRERLISSYQRIEDVSGREKDAEAVRSYLMEKYSSPDISLETISADMGMSQKRIADIVSREYAMTVKECINWIRINEAKRLLSETDMSIIDIAFRLGFNSSTYFATNFRNRERMAPSEYREKYGRVK